MGLTFEQAEAVKRGMPLPEGIEPRPIQPIIETVSDILALEIRKTMDFYRATAEESEEAIQKILVPAAVRSFPVLPEYLAKRFEIPVELFDPFRQIQVDGRKFDPDYMREIVPGDGNCRRSRLERSGSGMIKINLLESVTDRPTGAAMVEARVASPCVQTLLLALTVFGLLVVGIGYDYVSSKSAHARRSEELENQRAHQPADAGGEQRAGGAGEEGAGHSGPHRCDQEVARIAAGTERCACVKSKRGLTAFPGCT